MHRWRRVPRPRGIQLHLGHVAARGAAGGGPQQQVDVRHEEQEGGDHDAVAWPCVDGHLEAGAVKRATWKKEVGQEDGLGSVHAGPSAAAGTISWRV